MGSTVTRVFRFRQGILLSNEKTPLERTVTGMVLAKHRTTMHTKELSRIEKLVELYYQPLFRFAEKLGASPVSAMKLVQRTFRHAFESSRSLPVPADNRAWLFTILFREFLQFRQS
jgi:DNA-directed RNA polymerase specialized sigma24 family protein